MNNKKRIWNSFFLVPYSYDWHIIGTFSEISKIKFSLKVIYISQYAVENLIVLNSFRRDWLEFMLPNCCLTHVVPSETLYGGGNIQQYSWLKLLIQHFANKLTKTTIWHTLTPKKSEKMYFMEINTYSGWNIRLQEGNISKFPQLRSLVPEAPYLYTKKSYDVRFHETNCLFQDQTREEHHYLQL